MTPTDRPTSGDVDLGSGKDATRLERIIISNYNCGRILAEAIDSALGQTHPDKEVVVVDDGSTDNSRQIVASYRNQIIPVLKENGGQASTFNRGFQASRGEVVVFFDADGSDVADRVDDCRGNRAKSGDREGPLAVVGRR